MAVRTQTTVQKVVNHHLDVTASKDFQGNAWGARHVGGWKTAEANTTQAMGASAKVWQAVVKMLLALAEYADGHTSRYESSIGQDGVLGDDGWLSILKGVRVLLNGELGPLDGGTLDRLLFDMAEAAGFDRKEVDA